MAVDAGNTTAVARLRIRKHRPAKPLALMAREDRASFDSIVNSLTGGNVVSEVEEVVKEEKKVEQKP